MTTLKLAAFLTLPLALTGCNLEEFARSVDARSKTKIQSLREQPEGGRMLLAELQGRATISGALHGVPWGTVDYRIETKFRVFPADPGPDAQPDPDWDYGVFHWRTAGRDHSSPIVEYCSCLPEGCRILIKADELP